MPLRAKFVSRFDKQIDVFATSIIGTAKCKKTDAMVHAANVWAQWIDWRQTGAPGNPRVAASLSPEGKGVVITMFANDDDPAENVDPGNTAMHLHDLECNETPLGECPGKIKDAAHCFDNAHCELVQVLINQGYAQVWPDVFAPSHGVGDDDAPDDDAFPKSGTRSRMAAAMDRVIGDCGFAFNKTFAYPHCTGHYHYSDKTCEYSCLVSEFNYWVLTSVLGGQSGPAANVGRCDDISDEWYACTADRVKAVSPTAYEIMTDPQYALPTIMPDGLYKGNGPSHLGQ